MNAKEQKEKEKKKKNIRNGSLLIAAYYFFNAIIMSIENLQFLLKPEWWGLNSLAAIGCILVFVCYVKVIS